MHRIQFIFEAVGTRGTISPLLAIAEELAARKHTCHLLSHESFRSDASSAGIHFTSTTNQPRIFGTREVFDAHSYLFPGLAATLESFRELAASAQPTLAVNVEHVAASNLACELHGVAAVRLQLAPYNIRSLVDPPWPYKQRARGALGQTYLKYTLPAFYRAGDTDLRLLGPLNQYRLSAGLQPVESASHPEPHVREQIALFPEWFCKPAADWPSGIQLTGFPLPRPVGALSAELTAFLQRSSKPLVFTTGTGVHEVEAFFRVARECCEVLNRPGIFLSSHWRPSAEECGPHLLALDYAELGLLLPHVALLVHHAGIGTMARAFEAGVPQLVSPIVYDGPDNAQRAVELGVARLVERRGCSGRALADAAQALLGDAELPSRLASIQRRLEPKDCIRRTADLLEEHAHRHSSRRALSLSVPEALAPPDARTSAGSTRQRRTVLFVVWPERGHIAAPIALARKLRERGERVVFAGVGIIGKRVLSLGFEFFELARAQDHGAEPVVPSVFWSLPSRELLPAAVDALVVRFASAMAAFCPALVLLDSLYSAFGILMERAGVPWALFETDLPRELDPVVPPPTALLVPDGSAGSRQRIRGAWAQHLWKLRQCKRESRRRPAAYGWMMDNTFPDDLIAELEKRFGKRVDFNRRSPYAPLARVPRLVFCPRELDFQRTRTEGIEWVEPCIDERRPEPDFPWGALPANAPLVYCALGTQSLRDSAAPGLLRTVVDAFAAREEFVLVVSCHPSQRPLLEPAPPRVIIVSDAPQWALLQRATLAITHAGFNSVKECIACAVPMIAFPLSCDQPRNAALIQHRGLGIALDPLRVGAEELSAAVTRVAASEPIRASCRHFQALFRRSEREAQALVWIDTLLTGARPAATGGGIRTQLAGFASGLCPSEDRACGRKIPPTTGGGRRG